MVQTELVDLEATIKKMPGVLGCVILATPEGAPSEIQAFTQTGVDQQEVQRQILAEVGARGLESHLRQVFVFELEAETHFGDRETLERAAELAEQEARTRGPVGLQEVQEMPPRSTPKAAATPGSGRPPLLKVALTSSAWRSEAEVALGGPGDEVVGQAEGEKTPHGLRVLAQATLDAADKIVDGVDFTLRGASLVKVFEEEAVLVLVDVEGEYQTIGAALTRGGPLTEATVRATLDAVNRRLAEV